MSINKTKEQLNEKIRRLEQQILQLEASKAKHTKDHRTLQKLSSVVEQTADQVLITNKEGIIEYVNPAFEEKTGYSKEEVLGKTPRFLKSGQHNLQFYRTLWAIILSGQTFRSVLVNRKKNGELYYESKTITPIKDSRGQITHFVSTGKDITNRKQVEQTLAKRNRELALINNASQAFISTLDLDQVIFTILKGVQQLLDVSFCATWLIETDTQEIVCRQVSNEQAQPIVGWRLELGQGLAGWAAQHGKSLIVSDTWLDGRYYRGIEEHLGFELRSILCVSLKVKEQVIGVLQVMDTRIGRFSHSNLTLLESLAAAAAIAIDNARLYHQAQQDAHTKAVLLQEVNHRVKNNLAAIIGLLYAEQRHTSQLPLREKCRQLYQKLMNNLINRVQGLATVHGMLSRSEWAPLPLSELAKQVIYSAIKIMPENTTVVANVSPSLIKVTSDQAHNLALVFNELTINALKYATGSHENTEITVTITAKADWVTTQFRDNGNGYPQDVLNGSPQNHSTGMELIQKVVEKNLRGKLSLHNDDGAVTTLQFKVKINEHHANNKQYLFEGIDKQHGSS